MAKIAAAKDWRNRPLDKWNTTSFHSYLADKHTELFGCDYVPFPSWVAEKAAIGALIGTAGKNPRPRTASNDEVKAFIDATFDSYTPTAKYPGTSFGFMWKFRQNEWQRVQVEHKTKAKRAAAVTRDAMTDAELEDWL